MAKLAELKVTQEKRDLFASLLLLDQMINQQRYFTVGKFDNDILDLLINLEVKGYAKLNGTTYIPTDKGRDILSTFLHKYWQFVRVFDVYSAVDLRTGEFAFSQSLTIDSDEEWNELLHEDRFSDLRLTAANFKGVDPIESAFMVFLSEGKFDLESKGWEFNLVSTLIWDEVEEMVKESMDIDDLTYTDADGDIVEGKSVIEEVVDQGSKLMVDLAKEEDELDRQEQEDEDEAQAELEEDGIEFEEEEIEVVTYVETIEEEYYEPDYYDPYYHDPYYVDPLLVALILF